MSDINALQDAFMKADALAQQGDAQARADAAMFAAEIKRMQAAGTSQDRELMPQLNAGIAETAGGLVDLLNPFDKQTGSAREGLKRSMEAIGVNVATDDPQGGAEAFMRGAGNAAVGFVPAGLGLKAAATAPGMVGQLADDAAKGLATVPGALTEMLAGGIASSAANTAKEAGAPTWVQNTAAVAAPMSIPAAAATARGAGRLAAKTPAARIGRSLVGAVAPMSEAGARQVARTRLQDLAGGEERAAELGRQISNQDIIGRTPAQQTNDPNILGLEEAVAAENPVIRERLIEQTAAARTNADLEIGRPATEGSVDDTRAFFDKRLEQAAESRAQRVQEVLDNARPKGSEREPSQNSVETVRKLKMELEDAKQEERALWGAVPRDVMVGTANARAVAARWARELGRAGEGDMPRLARELLLDESGYEATESAGEVHRLYSKLRETARNARAGTQKQETLAKVADDIARAVLDDMDAVESVSGPLADARNMTRRNAELFDQGAVGRILRRTTAGDEQIAPETALARTVGRGGEQGVADDISIRSASYPAGAEISDYLRGQFAERILKPNGEFNRTAAQKWLQDNRELLSRYPEMREEMRRALGSVDNAETFAARMDARAKAGSRALVEFGRGQDTQAVASIIGADDPAKAARSVAATARKDKTGKATAGAKAAFSDYLVGKAGTDQGLSGARLTALLKDRNTRTALRSFFSAEEVKRMDQIAEALSSLDTPAMGVGPVIDTPANRILDLVARTQAARLGGAQGGGSMGGSLQTANIAVNNAQNMLRNLTNRRAREMLTDAVQDPELMRVLLMEPTPGELPKRARDKLTPYLVGAAFNMETQEDG